MKTTTLLLTAACAFCVSTAFAQTTPGTTTSGSTTTGTMTPGSTTTGTMNNGAMNNGTMATPSGSMGTTDGTMGGNARTSRRAMKSKSKTTTPSTTAPKM